MITHKSCVCKCACESLSWKLKQMCMRSSIIKTSLNVSTQLKWVSATVRYLPWLPPPVLVPYLKKNCSAPSPPFLENKRQMKNHSSFVLIVGRCQLLDYKIFSSLLTFKSLLRMSMVFTKRKRNINLFTGRHIFLSTPFFVQILKSHFVVYDLPSKWKERNSKFL